MFVARPQKISKMEDSVAAIHALYLQGIATCDCGASMDRAYLKKHQRHFCRNSEVKEYPCDTAGCRKTYMSRGARRAHIRKVHLAMQGRISGRHMAEQLQQPPLSCEAVVPPPSVAHGLGAPITVVHEPAETIETNVPAASSIAQEEQPRRLPLPSTHEEALATFDGGRPVCFHLSEEEEAKMASVAQDVLKSVAHELGAPITVVHEPAETIETNVPAASSIAQEEQPRRLPLPSTHEEALATFDGGRPVCFHLSEEEEAKMASVAQDVLKSFRTLPANYKARKQTLGQADGVYSGNLRKIHLQAEGYDGPLHEWLGRVKRRSRQLKESIQRDILDVMQTKLGPIAEAEKRHRCGKHQGRTPARISNATLIFSEPGDRVVTSLCGNDDRARRRFVHPATTYGQPPWRSTLMPCLPSRLRGGWISQATR